MLSLSRDEAVDLKVLSNPNSFLALTGLDSNPNARVSLPIDHYSQICLYSSNNHDYTIDQLFDGELDFSTTAPLSISDPISLGQLSLEEENKILADPKSDSKSIDEIWTRKLGGGKAINDLLLQSERYLEVANFTNSTEEDDTYGYYEEGDDDIADEPEISLENSQSPYTIILLPNNQTIILIGVNATDVAKTPEVYFLTQNQLTNLPSQQPSTPPSAQPTYFPSVGDLIMPSALPSSQPSNQPNAKPSLKPFANPSSIPSYKPSTIPSYESLHETSKPSAFPSGSSTSSPTSNPNALGNSNSSAPLNIVVPVVGGVTTLVALAAGIRKFCSRTTNRAVRVAASSESKDSNFER
ncbi:MAG: PT domain-containing protein [Proteobacteria bacterium]|nr:PT domain-containing protein [Pseudomonadota bacterium]